MTTGWRAVGLSQDLPLLGVMKADWQGQDLAVWRSASGRVSAWNDRCPHRGMRLSHGFVRGETLACIYHGWTYGAEGGCSHIPAHPAMTPPASIKADRFAVAEQDGVLWTAPEAPGFTPPQTAGLDGLRSMVIAATLTQVQRALPGHEPQTPPLWHLAPVIGGQKTALCLILQDHPGGTAVHALIGAGAGKGAASRWLEGLRRTAEQEIAA